MGSYISIFNDTSNDWYCKVGPDEAAVAIVGYIASALALLMSAGAALGPGMGALCAALADSSLGGAIGITAEGVASLASAVRELGEVVHVAETGIDVAHNIAEVFNKNNEKSGYIKIPPGTKHTWGKMSLSLWQQGKCQHTITADNTLVSEILYMRPIFSGATNGKDYVHYIKTWYNKPGVNLQRQSKSIDVILGGTSSLINEEVVSADVVVSEVGNKTVFLKAMTGDYVTVEGWHLAAPWNADPKTRAAFRFLLRPNGKFALSVMVGKKMRYLAVQDGTAVLKPFRFRGEFNVISCLDAPCNGSLSLTPDSAWGDKLTWAGNRLIFSKDEDGSFLSTNAFSFVIA